MDILQAIIEHINYIGAMALFVIGLYIVLANANMIKKVIGINIMETAIFLFFVSIGYVRQAISPILNNGQTVLYVNPLPSALILTGVVISVSITAYALSLVVRLYAICNTMDMSKISAMREDMPHE